MDETSRQRHIEATRDRVLAEQDTHVARLYQLETDHGFDLDVATDIYGLSFLDNTSDSVELAERWQRFYDSIGIIDEGGTLLISQVNKALVPGCYGFGAEEEFHYTSNTTLVRADDTTHIVYQTAITEGETLRQASIRLENVQILEFGLDDNDTPAEWISGQLVLAKPYGRAGAFNTGPLGSGAEGLVVTPVRKHSDVMRAAQQLEVGGVKMAYFALQPIVELLQLDKF